jgi:hypothetical protein
MTLYAKAKSWAKSSKLTQRVSRARLIRGFHRHIRMNVEQGDRHWKTNAVEAGMIWAEAGSYYGTLLEVFG